MNAVTDTTETEAQKIEAALDAYFGRPEGSGPRRMSDLPPIIP